MKSQWVGLFVFGAGLCACEDYDAVELNAEPVEAEIQGRVVARHARAFELEADRRVLVVPPPDEPTPEVGARVSASGTYERVTGQPFVRLYDKDYHPWEDMNAPVNSFKAKTLTLE